jgi:MOSC domain-containing protein YiiM
LIAAEALADGAAESGVDLEAGESRRNVLTRGIDLNALVGERFRVGDVECLGIELCEPCTTLEGLTRPGVIKAYVHRAGLNADILTDGQISVGDVVERL